MTAELGIEHPQEGVFNGHFKPTDKSKAKIIKQLQEGVLLPIKNKKLTPSPDRNFTIADMITGYGVSEAVNHYYDIYGGSIEGKKVIIQGWGNVGAAAAYYQAQSGAKIVGIIEKLVALSIQKGFF